MLAINQDSELVLNFVDKTPEVVFQLKTEFNRKRDLACENNARGRLNVSLIDARRVTHNHGVVAFVTASACLECSARFHIANQVNIDRVWL